MSPQPFYWQIFLNHRGKIFSKIILKAVKAAPQTPNFPSKTFLTFRRRLQCNKEVNENFYVQPE